MVFNRLMDNGVDLNKQLLEVSPMVHSFSGGIKVDSNYESTVKGLYMLLVKLVVEFMALVVVLEMQPVKQFSQGYFVEKQLLKL